MTVFLGGDADQVVEPAAALEASLAVAGRLTKNV
jgi:hypothetical protein